MLNKTHIWVVPDLPNYCMYFQLGAPIFGRILAYLVFCWIFGLHTDLLINPFEQDDCHGSNNKILEYFHSHLHFKDIPFTALGLPFFLIHCIITHKKLLLLITKDLYYYFDLSYSDESTKIFWNIKLFFRFEFKETGSRFCRLCDEIFIQCSGKKLVVSEMLQKVGNIP